MLHKNFWIQSTLHSYSQVFYSLHKGFALFLLLATMLDWKVGACGLAAALLINLITRILGFTVQTIREGLYGFNAVLLGLALGKQFVFNEAFVVLFFFAILLLLLISVWMSGLLAPKGLPYLSLPFIVTFWVIALAARNFQHIELNTEDIFHFNIAAQQQSEFWYSWVHSLDTWELPELVRVYFRTLSSTFFQSSLLAGILVAIGLFWWSRIAFSLSVIGISAAYYFYGIWGANIEELTYYMVGSNFIFMAIAIGAFFLIPNIYSYLAAVIMVPVLLCLMIAFNKILAVLQLPAFTLSFSIAVLLFLWALKQRWVHRFMYLVVIQYYSAEKTVYKYANNKERFAHTPLAAFHLPFWGQWTVSQGYDGRITHKGDWSKALDFVISDADNKTYQSTGTKKEDFYCFDKPIVAPADGYIYEIVDTVEDNDVTEVDTEKNWGNSLIINHTNGLFTQLSHIKKDSFQVKIGDYVKKGTVLASCGNSGRSPEPHLHFQIQDTALVGAKTLAYPLAYFIEHQGNKNQLKIAQIPQENTTISNVESTELLADAYGWLPNMRINVRSNNPRHQAQTQWQAHTDAYNRCYLHCPATNSIAYYINDGTMFYFTDFEGDKKSVLFQFYLASYRILLGYYRDIAPTDSLPLVHFGHWTWQWLQDFVAPFYQFMRADYQTTVTSMDNEFSPTIIFAKSVISLRLVGKTFRKIQFDLEITKDKTIRFKSKLLTQSFEIQCVGY